jgi:hypothetical protein
LSAHATAYTGRWHANLFDRRRGLGDRDLLDWPSVLMFGGGLALAYLCGYGLACLLLPAEYRSVRFLISPTLGIAAGCWLTFLISATFGIIVSRAVWWATLPLTGLTVAEALVGPNRSTLREIGKGLFQSVAVSVPILLCLLWPLFIDGAATYLGTVNPDFTFALGDSYFVRDRLSNTVGPLDPENSYAPFDTSSQRLSVHARYIGSLHGILLEEVFDIQPRTGLALALALWLFCYPQAIFVLSKIVAGLDNRAAAVSAVLAGMSGPVAMSYVLFFVGQNSALPMTPLLFTAAFLLLTKPTARIFGLTLLLLCCLFWAYPTQLPFVLTPALALAVYRIWRRELGLGLALQLTAALIGAFVVLHLGLGHYWNIYLHDWEHLSGGLARGNYFLDFLTENFLPMFFGLICYPPSNFLFKPIMGSSLELAAFLVSVAASLGFLAGFRAWARHVEDRGRVVLWSGACFVPFVAWWWYTFAFPYGYFALKMSTWIQFVILPIAGFGFVELWRWSARGGWRRIVALSSVLVVVGLNLITSIDYGYKTLGALRPRTAIVNVLGMSGNRDYLRMALDLGALVPAVKSIGLVFTNPTQSQWVTYYLRRWPLSVLTFPPFTQDSVVEKLPALPAPTGPSSENAYFHGASDDFYLLPNRDSWASDIAEQSLPKPDWRNATFEFYHGDRVHDLIVVGRGYYAPEHMQGTGYWWPKTFRWTAHTGELLLVRPSKKTRPNWLSMGLISGYGLNSADRTVEFFQDGHPIGEVSLHGAARILSPPFVPTHDVERIVFQVTERVRPTQRRLAVWNRQIPSDYRQLNLAIGEVRLVTEDDLLSAEPATQPLEGSAILRNAYMFDGMEVDGWVQQVAEASFVRPADSVGLELQFFVPGDAGYRFPYNIVVEVDGNATVVRAAKPGTLLIQVPMKPAPEKHLCHIRIHTGQSYRPQGYPQTIRPTTHSVHWDAVRFKTERNHIESVSGN